MSNGVEFIYLSATEQIERLSPLIGWRVTVTLDHVRKPLDAPSAITGILVSVGAPMGRGRPILTVWNRANKPGIAVSTYFVRGVEQIHDGTEEQ